MWKFLKLKLNFILITMEECEWFGRNLNFITRMREYKDFCIKYPMK